MPMTRPLATRSFPWLVIIGLLLPLRLMGQAMSAEESKQLERSIFKELIEINTGDSAGGTPAAAAAMAKRLTDAGLPAADVQVLGFAPRYQSLVARYRGTNASGQKPLLLMAHLDVVEARREDWSVDPFTFLEKEGYYYGRGTSDDKQGAAILIATLIKYQKEGFRPDRDLIVVLTADEETAGESIKWLVKEHRDLIDAEYALNTDAGGGTYVNGKPTTFSVQAAEKVYLSFQLEVRNRGGHSSIPIPDNAIYHLSEGLTRLAHFAFPVRLTEVARAYFERVAPTEKGQVAVDMKALAARNDPAAARRLSAANPYWNSVMRTTCVATRLFGGHADNALPQVARATVNCRLLPDDPAEKVEATLNRVLADTAIKVSRIAEPTLSPPSPLRPEIVGPIEHLVQSMWPGAAVVPEMSTGATDGLYVRNVGIPVYGASAVFEEINDTRAHGRDERIEVKAFHNAARFWYELVKQLSSAKKTT